MQISYQEPSEKIPLGKHEETQKDNITFSRNIE
jgi:hypothetical protein